MKEKRGGGAVYKLLYFQALHFLIQTLMFAFCYLLIPYLDFLHLRKFLLHGLNLVDVTEAISIWSFVHITIGSEVFIDTRVLPCDFFSYDLLILKLMVNSAVLLRKLSECVYSGLILDFALDSKEYYI